MTIFVRRPCRQTTLGRAKGECRVETRDSGHLESPAREEMEEEMEREKKGGGKGGTAGARLLGWGSWSGRDDSTRLRSQHQQTRPIASQPAVPNGRSSREVPAPRSLTLVVVHSRLFLPHERFPHFEKRCAVTCSGWRQLIRAVTSSSPLSQHHDLRAIHIHPTRLHAVIVPAEPSRYIYPCHSRPRSSLVRLILLPLARPPRIFRLLKRQGGRACRSQDEPCCRSVEREGWV